MTPEGIWLIFIFLMGSCVGSFLNVVIYRLPREKSIVTPPSACPKCGKNIAFYDNIPLFSWLILRGKCRNCSAQISIRYFIVELIVALMFIGVYFMLFKLPLRNFGFDQPDSLDRFLQGGWLIYISIIILLTGLLASSAIDLELWIIPISICWFVTLAGFIISSSSVFLFDLQDIQSYRIFPSASARTGSLATGGLIGLIISLILLKLNIFKLSYADEEIEIDENDNPHQYSNEDEFEGNHRLEMLKEVIFLSPVVICSILLLLLTQKIKPVSDIWLHYSQIPAVAGFLGSLWGYFVGCGIVWLTRILGTLCFNKEAMGLGDVHLMGAAGAVIGPVMIVIAFFVAPFFGLGWAIIQMFFQKTRQIPYGPFLSLGVLAVIIFHDRFWDYINNVLLYR